MVQSRRVGDDEAIAPKCRKAAPRAGDEPLKKSAGTILIVDDEPHIAAVVALKLEDAGYRTRVCSDGREALRLAQSELFDAVVSDLNMPKFGGADLCRALAASTATAGLPVLLVTGLAHAPSELSWAHPNVRGVIAKPFSPREMLVRLEAMLAEVRRVAAAA